MATSCKNGLIVGVLSVACHGLCTAARFHTTEENPGCILGSLKVLIACGIKNCGPTLFDHLRFLWPGTGECISPTDIFNDLLSKIAVRRDRLFILVAGLTDAYVTSFNLRRTHRGLGLDFRQLMYGRSKNDDCHVSRVGPHVSIDVLRFQS